MMFYKNLNKGNMKFKNINFNSFKSQMNNKDDDKSAPFGLCERIYNFSNLSGALTDGIGIGDLDIIYDSFYDISYKKIEIPNMIIKGCYFLKYWNKVLNSYDYLIIIYCSDQKLYYNVIASPDTSWMEIKNIQLTTKPIALYTKVNDIDSLIFYSEKDGMQVWDVFANNAYKVENPPNITSMCIHQNRLFATIGGESRSVIFSEELNPINFNVSTDEGGYINMDDEFGKCNSVVSFDGYLYIFRDYNIAKVSEGKDRNQFVINQLYVGNGKIYPNTISICGNKIMFLASDGIYEFNGTVSKKINFNFDNMIDGIDNHFFIAKYFNGHYYLSCNINFGDNDKYACENLLDNCNNSLIKIDISNYNCEIMRGCDIRDFTVVDDGVNNCIIVNYAFNTSIASIGLINQSGSIKDKNIRKFWKSKMYDFNIPSKYKYIKEISFISKSDIELNLYLDEIIKTYKISGKNTVQKIKVNEKAVRFGVGFVSEENNVYISIPQVKVGFYGEYK